MQVQDKLKKVQQIRATHHAFAAILADGSVVTWGNGFCGGDSSQVQQELQGQQSAFAAILEDGIVNSAEVRDRLKGVQQIRATHTAFAAILSDGSVLNMGVA
jgi:alpha-tubulin suppressor-like RCC1 family protein